MRPHNRFTVFDMMEAKGFFARNPANAGATSEDGQVLYQGPQPYPKMMYHPLGEEKVIRQAEAQVTPFGPRLCNEQREMVSKIVNSKAEEKELVLSGWHDHPAKAMAAGIEAGTRGGIAPPISSASRIADLEAQIAALEEERDRSQAQLNLPLPPPTKGNPKKEFASADLAPLASQVVKT